MSAEKEGLRRLFEPIPAAHSQELLEDVLDDKDTAKALTRFFTEEIRVADLAFELQVIMSHHYERRHPSVSEADEVEDIRAAHASTANFNGS